MNNRTSSTRYCLTKVCIFTYIPKFHLNLLIFGTSFRYPTKWSMQVKESIQCHKLLVFIRIHFQPKSLPNNQMPLALASTVPILSESGSTAGASSDDTHIYTTPQLTHVPQGSWLGIWEGLGCWEFVNVQRAFHIGTNILTGGRDLCMIKLCTIGLLNSLTINQDMRTGGSFTWKTSRSSSSSRRSSAKLQ